MFINCCLEEDTADHYFSLTIKNYVYTGITACDTTAFRLFDFKIIHDFGITGDKGIWLTESAVRQLDIDQRRHGGGKSSWRSGGSDGFGHVQGFRSE